MDGMNFGWAGRESPADGRLLTLGAQQRAIGEKEIHEAVRLLTEYKQGKSSLEGRVVEDEQWYKLRHWEALRRKGSRDKREESRPEPASAWMFNAIANKHADAMDNFPEPNVLPREKGDTEDAKSLSSVLPVVLERNDFEDTYSQSWWEKLKHGTAAYGVFWNNTLENGLGDVDIRSIDLLNIFWEPGIADLQKSRNLFLVDVQDKDLLETEYPALKGKLDGGNAVEVARYVYDDTVSTEDKAVVVDWYYKRRAASGRTVLHYAKFVGTTLLFASENEAQYAEAGWYDHGMYPVVLDTLYPEKGTPVGFGYVALTKDPQLYIDKLGQNILEASLLATRRRFFVSESTAINEQEFLDAGNPLVRVAGQLDDTRIREIEYRPIDGVYTNILQMKIDELKETSSNRDVSAGGVTSGVTAASAIAALQEAGNKGSRDMIGAAYRAYTKIGYLCIELMRQFYDEERSFRITGETPGEPEFVSYSNAGLRDQPMGMDSQGAPMFRRPIFDIKIRAQKRNPFSRMSQNELAKELYSMGFFNPERAQEAQGALEMMEFEGKDRVMERVLQGETLLNMLQQMSAQVQELMGMVQMLTGGQPSAPVPAGGGGSAPAPPAPKGGGGLNGEMVNAQKPMTGYGERLAARAAPNMNSAGSVMG